MKIFPQTLVVSGGMYLACLIYESFSTNPTHTKANHHKSLPFTTSSWYSFCFNTEPFSTSGVWDVFNALDKDKNTPVMFASTIQHWTQH